MKQKTLGCQLCGKTTQTGFNRPKSLHKTHRFIHPNIQKWNGLLICNRCRRMIELKKAKPSTTSA